MSINLQEISRALDLSGVSGVLVQPEIQKIIAQLVEFKNPIRQNLPVKPGSGTAAYINRRSAASTPAAFVADTDEPVESTGTYAQVNFPYKTILSRGKITRKAQAVGKSYKDIMTEEVDARAREFKDFEEWALFWGSTTISANYFDGLYKQLISGQKLGTTTAVGGEAMTLADLDAIIHKCIGTPDMIFCSKATFRQLNGLLQTYQRFVNQVEVKGGFVVPTYQGIPIYQSTRIHDNLYYSGTGINAPTSYSGGTGATSVLFVVDTTELWREELVPVTIKPLATTSSQFEQFDIYCDESLVMRNTLNHAALEGIKIT